MIRTAFDAFGNHAELYEQGGIPAFGVTISADVDLDEDVDEHVAPARSSQEKPSNVTDEGPFRQRLTAALNRLFSQADGALVVLGDEERNCYAQFACDGTEVQFEAVGADLITTPSELTKERKAALTRLGWNLKRPNPNYTHPASVPADAAALDRLVDLVLATLRDGYGCDDPEQFKLDEIQN